MTCLLLAVLLAAPGEPSSSSLSAVPVVEATQASPTGSSTAEGLRESVEPRRFHEINEDLRYRIRGFARAESRAEQAGWARQMCVLYLEIKRDPRLATSDTLNSYKAKLWSVLQRIQLDIAQQLAREQRQKGQQQPSQQGQTGERLAHQQAARSGEPSADQASEPPIAADASDSLAGSLSLLGGLLGGPGDLMANGGSFGGGSLVGGSFGGGSFGGGSFGGGAAGGDYGLALVELIQRTIAPEFWDVNGGPGTIVYYAPLRVLVVRATSEMHHDVGAAVGAVRRAGQ